MSCHLGSPASRGRAQGLANASTSCSPTLADLVGTMEGVPCRDHSFSVTSRVLHKMFGYSSLASLVLQSTSTGGKPGGRRVGCISDERMRLGQGVVVVVVTVIVTWGCWDLHSFAELGDGNIKCININGSGIQGFAIGDRRRRHCQNRTQGDLIQARRRYRW